VIAGERAEKPVREFTAEGGLEAIASAGARLGQTGDAGAVVEQAADGLAVGGRRCVHGPLVIGGRPRRTDPWRE
jgi:hypothetical protein